MKEIEMNFAVQLRVSTQTPKENHAVNMLEKTHMVTVICLKNQVVQPLSRQLDLLEMKVTGSITSLVHGKLR